MFTITKENDLIEVSRINLLIYGQPGVGKTTLGFSAMNPILLDVDEGSHRAMFYKDHIRISNWAEISNNMNAFAETLKQYDTVIIDTIDKLLRLMMVDIKLKNAKVKDGRMLYGILKEQASMFISTLKASGKDIVQLAHETEKESSDGDSYIRAQITGGTAGLVTEVSDVVGRMFFRGKDRVIDFTPSDKYFTKDAGLGVYTIPPNDELALAQIMSIAKQEFKARAIRRKERREEAILMIETIKTATTADSLNSVIAQIKAAPESLKALYRGHVVAKATELELTLQGGKYVQSVSITA